MTDRRAVERETRSGQRPGDPHGRPQPPSVGVIADPLEDPEVHGAGAPPQDALADATRRLVVDDHEARQGFEPPPVDPAASLGDARPRTPGAKDATRER